MKIEGKVYMDLNVEMEVVWSLWWWRVCRSVMEVIFGWRESWWRKKGLSLEMGYV